MESDSPEELANQLLEEAQELVGAINTFDVTQNAEYQIISEVGDVFYLLLKFCHDMGIDPEQAVRLKLLRNSVKYPDYLQNNGLSHEESKAMSKELWASLGGDNAFFAWHALSTFTRED